MRGNLPVLRRRTGFLLAVQKRCITVADLGEGPGWPGSSPFFLDQNEARKAEKIFLGDNPPPFLRVWMTDPLPLSQGLDPALNHKVSILPFPSSWLGRPRGGGGGYLGILGMGMCRPGLQIGTPF